jgi:two-component system phosphate regulon response regulator PhoB
MRSVAAWRSPNRLNVTHLRSSVLWHDPMRSKHVLVVDDERPVREMITFGLLRSGFEVGQAGDAEAARLSIAKRQPDLVILDWVLPGMSGLDLLRELRSARETREISIVMVTARADEQDRILALDTGADAYVTKPFSARELLARINAVLRRSGNGSNGGPTEACGLVLDAARQRVNAGERAVQLSPTDFRLLQFFMMHPERVHSRTKLLDHVWGGAGHAEERTVDVEIRRLRKALEALRYDRFIQTVRGVGYRFSSRFE